MKKRQFVFILLIAIILVAMTGAFALSEPVRNALEGASKAANSETPTSLEVRATVSGLQKDAEAIAIQLESTVEDFDFAALLEANGIYPDEIAKTLKKLLRLKALYVFSDEDVAALYQWTSSGCDLDKLLDVYEFAQDTDQPNNWNYAKQIYDKAIEIHIYGKNWIEGAFNALTANRGGILDGADVAAYTDAGLTLQEMQFANIMSRKGKKTIHEILDERLAGKGWQELAEEIYSETGLNAESFDTITDVAEIYTRIVLADVSELNVNHVALDPAAAQQKLAAKNRAAQLALEQLSIPAVKSEKIIAFAKEKLPDLTENEIKKLIDEGHTIRNMEKEMSKAVKAGVSLSEYLNNEEGAK